SRAGRDSKNADSIKMLFTGNVVDDSSDEKSRRICRTSREDIKGILITGNGLAGDGKPVTVVFLILRCHRLLYKNIEKAFFNRFGRKRCRKWQKKIGGASLYFSGIIDQ